MTTKLHVQEWHQSHLQKAAWGYGEWTDEPDKVQWVDAVTGLDCLIVRGPVGALCGYVGVPESHPWFGKEYSACLASPACEESWCDHRVEGALSVHGGVTFSDGCHEPTREAWERWCKNLTAGESEAVTYPRGDSARRLATLGHLRTDYDAWKAYGESAFICHRPRDGQPDRVWWFGFDCAHSGDFCPGMDRSFRSFETYKDRAYVEAECASLASQLAAGARGPND